VSIKESRNCEKKKRLPTKTRRARLSLRNRMVAAPVAPVDGWNGSQPETVESEGVGDRRPVRLCVCLRKE